MKRNGLEGTLPTEISGLSDLDLLLLEQNKLQGNADVICSFQNTEIDKFVADCGEGDNHTIGCSCCTECCNQGDAECNAYDWKGNLDPIWEYGFKRERYSYDLGPIIWTP